MRNPKTLNRKIQKWFSEPIMVTRIEKIIPLFLITALIIICSAILVQSKNNNAKEFHSGMTLSEVVNTLDDTIPYGYEAEIRDIKTDYAKLKNEKNASTESELADKIIKEIDSLIIRAKDNIDR